MLFPHRTCNYTECSVDKIIKLRLKGFYSLIKWCIVFKVAKVNPRDSSYLLRDDFYRHVQKDWPGYSEEERQQIIRLLARWVRQELNQDTVKTSWSLNLPVSFCKVNMLNIFVLNVEQGYLLVTLVWCISYSFGQVVAPVIICHLLPLSLFFSHTLRLLINSQRHSMPELATLRICFIFMPNFIKSPIRPHDFALMPLEALEMKGFLIHMFVFFLGLLFLFVKQKDAAAHQPPVEEFSIKFISSEDFRGNGAKSKHSQNFCIGKKAHWLLFNF